MMENEPEILDGTRAFPEAQAALRGAVDPSRESFRVQAGWYDTSVDPHEGSFCMVAIGSDLEELVGDVVSIRYRGKEVFCYCIGGASLATPIALARTAYFRGVTMLSEEEVSVRAQAVLR